MTDPLTDLKPVLARLAAGETLDSGLAEAAFTLIMSGEATKAQIGALLMALRLRGETVDEITGAVRAMRSQALTLYAPASAMDIVGTGGDGKGSYNVSTGAALVVAGCGVPIAKHGNRALSSRSGSADVLKELGINIDADMNLIERAIVEAGIGFMSAPRHHSAMRHVAGPRVEMGTRTVFNILGPLSNPALVKRQFTGVFAPEWVEPLARVLGNLGLDRAWVVHGSDGLDEMTTTGPTHVAEYRDGRVSTFDVTPEDAGLPRGRPEDLVGGDPSTNARAIHDLLDGRPGPYRDIVLMNAAGSLIVADQATDLRDGVARAMASIDEGRARAALDKLIAITNG